MAVMVGAGILGRWLIGRLAGCYDRLLVLRVQVSVVTPSHMTILSQTATTPVLFVFRASGFTLHPATMTWTCERVEYRRLAAMNQALLMGYTIDNLLGPTLTAILM